jgi:CubicO group peptidase (beta-lactamase class C family)
MTTNREVSMPATLLKNVSFACLLVLGLSGTLSGCASTPSLAATASMTERQAFVTSWADRVLAEQQDSEAAGVAIIVVKDGKGVLNRSKGMADRVNRIAINDHTLFALASQTPGQAAITACGCPADPAVQSGIAPFARPDRSGRLPPAR